MSKGQIIGEPVKERLLAWKHHGFCLRNREPSCRVDFGKRLAQAAARRPLDLEAIAHDRSNIEILLEREAFDDLSPSLPVLAQRNKRTLQWYAKLFLGFAQGDSLRVFTRRNFSLRYLPSAAVAPTPIGSAGMDEQDFRAPALQPIKQYPGASRHHWQSQLFVGIDPLSRSSLRGSARQSSAPPRSYG
ncbi:hypothetical protein GGC65_004082 [Sphingopyxis sp. OAS728]|nr:hypothetical protein [Sphingopyxis sp. OAS728]